MANIVADFAGTTGFDPDLFFGGDLSVRDNTQFSAGDDQIVTKFNGNFVLTTLGDDVVSGGTVNSITLRARDDQGAFQTVGQINAIGADAAAVWDLVDLGEKSLLFELLFANNDNFTGSKYNDVFQGFGGNDSLFGAEGKDALGGGEGNDTLNGGAARDTLTGGAGDDAYYTDRLYDTVFEDADGGIDTVFARAGMTLAANVENLTLQGSAVSGKGNELNNLITGTESANSLQGMDGDDTLTGNGGADTLTGGIGNDVYEADGNDVIREFEDGGVDIVIASQSIVLAANVENLVLGGNGTIAGTGNTSDNQITGNDAANTLSGMNGADTLDGGLAGDSLVGGAGNDVLIGGAGVDTMKGALGDDTYVVDVAADVVSENPDAGTDEVQASVSYTLGADIERLVLTGGASIDATGSAGDNTLQGNTGNNVLDGGAGIDTVAYAFATTRVAVNLYLTTPQDTRAGGTDTLIGFENVTGGSGDDHLIGDAGANVLDGGIGVDTLLGGLGNDILVVDSEDDIATEWKHEGVDEVVSSVSWAIDPAIENLTLTGTDNNSGFGNSENFASDTDGDNLITGNAGNNELRGYNPDQASPVGASDGTSSGSDTIFGGEGADTISGGDGADSLDGGAGDDLLGGGPSEIGLDTMSGGAGDDTFVFNSTLGDGNVKTISDFDIGGDVLSLDVAIFTQFGGQVGEDGWFGHWVSESFVIIQDHLDTGSFDNLHDLLLYEQPTGDLYYNRDANGALQRIASLPSGLYLSDSNFELFGTGAPPGP